MQINLIRAATCVAILFVPAAATAATTLTPGLYEYTIKMSMPGAPTNMPPQTTQRCLSAKDVDGSKAYEMPTRAGSDCHVQDMNQSGGQFSYKIACTKPQKIDGSAQGSITPTSMTMNMTMTLPNMPGPMTQAITAKRIGDCKP